MNASSRSSISSFNEKNSKMGKIQFSDEKRR